MRILGRSVGVALAALLVLAAGAARAQSCPAEQEPNDDPSVAQPVAAAFCIAGSAGDGPDVVRWHLGAGDAARLWSLKLEALPGEGATIVLDAADGSAPPVTVDGFTDVLLPERALAAGDYLVTVTVSGASGLYHLMAVPGGPAPVVTPAATPVATATVAAKACAAEREPNDDAGTAEAVAPLFCVAGSAADGTDAFRWSLGPKDVGTLWSLVLESLPGQSATIDVQAIDPATGETRSLTTKYGDYAALDVAIPDRMFTAGDYLILVTTSGGAGLYHLASVPGDALPPADPDATTTGLTNESAVVASSADYGATIPWHLDPSGAGQRWDIGVQAPAGSPTTLTLTDAAGSQITYAYTGADGVARLSDVAAAPGDYQLQVSGSLAAGDPLLVETAQAGPIDPAHESEPNNEVGQAFPFDPATGVTGRLIGNAGSADADIFSLTLDETWRDRRFDLVLKAPEAPDGLTLALVDDQGQELQTRSGAGEVRLADLVLEPGTAFFQVRGTLPADQSYTVTLEPRGPVAEGAEREPNDRITLATALAPEKGATGRFFGDETDFFAFTVEGEPQLWRVAVDGPALRRLAIDETGGGQAVSVSPSGTDRTEVSNVLLVPGRHVLALYGTDGPYAIALTPLGRPDLARDELEPDDDLAHALLLHPGIERTGVLDHVRDADVYRFSLAAETHVRLTLAGIPESDVTGTLYWGDTNATVGTMAAPRDATGPAIWDGMLPAGDYFLSLYASDVSATPYRVLLEPLPYYERQADIEPNGRVWQAGPLPPDLHLAGSLGNGDADWYRLPDLAEDTEITFRSRIGDDDAFGRAYLSLVRRTPLPDAGFWPRWSTDRVADIERGDEPGTWRATVPAGENLYIGLEGGDGAYDLHLTIPGHPAGAAAAPPPVSVSVALADAPVAAFAKDGQAVDGTIMLDNTGGRALSLDLATHAGDARWQVVPDAETVELPPGGSATVPVRVTVAPMALAGTPVTIEVAASERGGPSVSAAAAITPAAGIETVSPVAVPPLPEPLLGGLNVAWSGFGATMLDDGDQRLIDGLSSNSTTARFDRDMLATVRPVVQLAGEAPVALAGVVLERGMGNVASRLADFTISVSTDGTSFKPVLDGRMSPALAEQAFAFAAPVKARFVRLEPRSNQAGDTENYGADLGELKVIAVAGTTLGLPDEPDGFDVARADCGGHVVRKTVDVDAASTLTSDDDALFYWPSDEQRALGLGWVVAFRADRAAEIHALTWAEGEGFDPALVLPSVEVAVATEGADGPWTDLGRWTLQRDAGGQARLDLPAPVWARYVRFTAAFPEGGSSLVLPARIGIIERPVDRDHPSILGEWGLDRPDALFERSAPPMPAVPSAAADAAGASRDAATLLAPDEAVSGSVRLGVREDWYRLKVPADRPHLTLALDGRPAGAVLLTVEDAKGGAVALTETGDGDRRVFQADLAPGGYYVRISEPPRSVILSWDTSISVSPYTPEIVQAIMGFVSEIEPGREEVNLIPFGSDDGTKPLLEQWSGDPLVVYSALQSYGWSDTSSNAEAALDAANEAFRGRPGTHAILIITDGESNGGARNPAVWAGFDRERPRIFSVAVPTDSAVPDVLQGRAMLQDWAMLNGGSYRVMASGGSVASAFAELTASLRAPAPYTLTARLDVPPEPGRIAVTASPSAPDAAPDQPALVADQAIEIIVDLSGSMLQRIDGERKSEIAKSILTDLVTNSLPAGLPFALRVFGQGEPGSCDTGLVSALAPLDPATVAAVIAPIEPTNLAKTPIAASLAAVRDDLVGATGKRLVILITDGEETCDGDPAAEIAGLRDAGIDVRVNIVGFALDDAALKDTFSDWAKLGGGAFFEATDKDTLAAAMDAAVQPEFDVVDASGAVMGHGTVGGEPIEVPAGPYTVRILSAPEREIPGVTVAPGEITTVAAE